MSCANCQDYTFDMARQQVITQIGFETLQLRLYCKVCHSELLADFEKKIILRLERTDFHPLID